MHPTIKGALRVSAALAALAALATGCSKDSHTDSAGKSSAEPTSPSSSHPGLGDIFVGGKAVTGSTPTGNTKVPYQRTYSDGSLYASVTGYRSMLYGNAGLEALYDDVLATGASGTASGDVVTTIDPAAQKAAFDALGDRQGAAVALDAESGKLLAVVSTPSYDPATFSGGQSKDAEAWKTANAHGGSPMLNRALHRADAPGATFSVVVAAAALEQGLYTTVDGATSSPLTYVLPATQTSVTGTSPQCKNASIKLALRYSCDNVFTKMAADLGSAQLSSMAAKFGFNDGTLKVPLPVSESSYPEAGLSSAQAALTGIGGGEVRATPLEMARIAAVIANGGRLLTPQLVERVTNADGSTQHPNATASGGHAEQVISRRTADALQSALKTTESKISGKTGWVTDTQSDSATSWFTGYADRTDGRRIAVAVCIEGLPSSAGVGSGSEQAVQVAEEILTSVA